MTENKAEAWITWLALTTAILAVLAAVTTLYMGKFSSRAIMSQGQETNQWSYYQAKSIKSYIYEIQKQKLDLELELFASQGKLPKAYTEKARRIIADYDKKIARYDQEKEDIKAKADELMGGKELAQRQAGNYGYALIFLQIAIMLSSVAALTKKKHLWQFSLITVVGWAYFFLNATFLFY